MKRLSFRLLPIQIGVIATFLLIPLWYRLPFTIPLLPDLYASRFLLILPLAWTILAWLIVGLPNVRRFAASRWRLTWGIALLCLAVWALLSQSWAFVRFFHPEIAQSAGFQFVIVACFAVAAASSGTPPRAVVAALIIGLMWNSALVIAQAANNGALGLTTLGEFPYNLSVEGASIIRAGSETLVRPYGLLPHPNIVAGILLIGCLAAASWVLAARRWQRYVGSVILAIGVFALLLTFSRAAWGGFALGLGVIALMSLRRLRQFWGAIAVAAILMLIAVTVFYAQYRPFIVARTGEGQESVELRSISDRIVFTDFALRSIGERLLVGVGAGNFPWRASAYLQSTFYDLRGDNVHHVLLSVWAELGTVGLVLMIVAIISASAAAFRQVRAETFEGQPYRLALLAIFVALFAVGWLDHYPYTLIQGQVAWWGCIAIALGVTVKRESQNLIAHDKIED
jgi:O-antigen ligase